MTGTLSGYLVHRLQDSLKLRGHEIDYDSMIYSLTEALMALDRDMETGEFVELPNGHYLTITK